MEIKGSLRDDHLPDLLQALVSLGKSGTLVLEEGRGPLASVTLEKGRVHAARCLHLAGEEALLGCLFWNQGSYFFQDDLGMPPGAEAADLLPVPFDLSRFLIRALFLADELERRRPLVPAADAPLTLADAGPVEDPFGCELPAVAEALRRQPGITRGELEASLPLAPVRVRLALALLAEAGASRPPWAGQRRQAPPADPLPGPGPRHDAGGTVRVLVLGQERFFAADQFYSLADSLTAQLGAPPPWTSFVPSGPSFIRLRPAGGGLLTVSCVPMDGDSASGDCLAFVASHDLVVAVGQVPQECARTLAGLGQPVAHLEDFSQVQERLLLFGPPERDGQGDG